jgi:hypothetical protein
MKDRIKSMMSHGITGLERVKGMDRLLTVVKTALHALFIPVLNHTTGMKPPKTKVLYTGLFISPSGISELDCAKTKKDMAERSISTGRESLQVFCTRGLGLSAVSVLVVAQSISENPGGLFIIPCGICELDCSIFSHD